MSTTLEAGAKIELRATKAQKAMIERAAEVEGVNVKAFIFSRIIPEASRILGEQTLFLLNEADWKKFNAILNRPAKPNAKLRALMTTPSVLEKRKKPHGKARKP
jgi:uncharacterized protein (DUF1778 family)